VAAAHALAHGLTQARPRVGANCPCQAVTWAKWWVVAITDGRATCPSARIPGPAAPWKGEEPVDLKEEVNPGLAGRLPGPWGFKAAG